MNFRFIFTAITLIALLSGCGQSGGLYLPQHQSAHQSQQEAGAN